MIASIRKARMALGNHHTHVLLFQRLLVQLYLTSILVSRLLAEIVFEVLRFTSRSFTGLFTRNGIPSSINVEQIEKAGADYTIYRKLDELIKSVNANDGFGILGWIHIGLKNYVYSTDGGKVRSSDMVCHVTRMRPHTTSLLSSPLLINIKDVLYASTHPVPPAVSAKTGGKSTEHDTSQAQELGDISAAAATRSVPPAASAKIGGKSTEHDTSCVC